MRQQALLTITLLLISMSLFSQNNRNTYKKEWTEVNAIAQKSLPQSAIKKAQEILDKAIIEKNIPQIMKAYVMLEELNYQIDSEKESDNISKLEKLISETQLETDKALIHSVLADLYYSAYNEDRWNISGRTNLADDIPSDIKEWSSNIFVDTIYHHLEGTLKYKEALKKATTQIYDDIVYLGKDSRIYQPTLYDFIMIRTIKAAGVLYNIGFEGLDFSITGASIEQLLLPAKDYKNILIHKTKSYVVFNYYQDYLADLLERGMTASAALMDLNKLNYINSMSYYNLDSDKRLNALYSYEETYRDNDITVEIIDAITNQLSATDYSYWIIGFNEISDINIRLKQYEWLQKGIKRYPNYQRIGILKNKLLNLEEPMLRLEGKNLYYTDEAINIDIIHRNNRLVKQKKEVSLYRFEGDKKKLVRTYPITFSSKKNYLQDSTKLDLGILPTGRYFLKSNLNKSLYGTDSLAFSVSDWMTYSRNYSSNNYEIFVVNRKNGKPVEGATVTVIETRRHDKNAKDKVLATFTTDNLGRAEYQELRNNANRWGMNTIYTVSNEEGQIFPEQYLYKAYFSEYTKGEIKPEASIFTDRSIYRPGQTLYFKAITIDKDSHPIKNSQQKIKLYNTNNEEIGEKTLITNEFGSISGEFILPKGGLTGNHYLILYNDSYSIKKRYDIRVEEYKRPTFDVKFDKIDKTFSFGEKIVLKGTSKTFSGIALQDTDVQYNIMRRPFSFWYWDRHNESHFQDGTVKTKEDGTFEIEFIPKAGDNTSLFRNNIYTFDITATITDLNGETQSGTYSITVGEVSMLLNVEMPSEIEKSTDFKIEIKAKNLDGADINTSGTYTVSSIDEKDSIVSKMFEGTFKTGNQEEIISKIRKLASDRYRFEVIGKDDNGKEITSFTNFVLYSFDDTTPPYETNCWLAKKETTFRGDKPVEIVYGSSNKDVYVLYQIHNNKRIFEQDFFRLDNENKPFTIPYKSEYGEEVYISFTAVNNGTLQTSSILLNKEEEVKDTKLNAKVSVFRDRLRPGQNESWTLHISDTAGNPVLAEVLASMYDISLDQILPYKQWTLQRPFIGKEYLSNPNYNQLVTANTSYTINLGYKLPLLKVKNLDFDQLILYGTIIDQSLMEQSDVLEEVVVVNYGTQKQSSPTGAATRSAAPMLQGKVAGVSIANSATAVEEGEYMDSDELEAEASPLGEEATTEPQVRQNFNETAFFYPQLRTNDKGDVNITFTVPESNTTWRFRAFAHDQEGKLGELEKMVVTRKELMVTPNMPRFLRHGDTTSISTKISNLSENAISGKVRIEFFNPIDEKVINLRIENEQQTFSLEKDASSSASWTFDIPKDIEMLGVKIVAQSESFSDGEQHALPVLPNRMLVTETMPVDVTKEGEQTYNFEKLINNNSKTLENYKLTFEFTNNPAWYAVQALPTLNNPNDENAFSWFASYYANTMGKSLMQQYPRVANVIKAWTAKGGNESTLISQLEKNEELKTILLEETPWVLDAKNETEQMERLALLFDLNRTTQLTNAAIDKLKELQLANGAWSWYKGLYPNRGLTQYFLFAFANLQQVGMVEYPQKVKEMQMSAIKYVDEAIRNDYTNLKSHNKLWREIKSISTNQLEYLYTRAMYRDIPISQETREAERFYTEVVSKNWTKLNLYEKALLAVLAKELGNTNLANDISQSIREHAVTDAEMGMYWPNNKNNVFLSMSAVCSHIFMMEALKVNGATVEEMDMMKRWLVKQKQAQHWESTNATIHAIGVLLQEGGDWFTTDDTTPKIKLGKVSVKPVKQELGTGYFKTSWTGSDIKQDMGKVSITSKNSNPAYGALYWQYYEDLDKISKQDGSLNISKELYKEVTNEAGKSLVKITSDNPLRVGDKVIARIVVRSDRDLEFVQIKDMRAACFEPLQTLSGIGWQNSIPYYQATKDASTNFFFDVMPKGTYVFEYPVYVNRSGEYSNGISSIQCAYAPEFTAHTDGIKVIVK